jgi:hypothetical protein
MRNTLLLTKAVDRVINDEIIRLDPNAVLNKLRFRPGAGATIRTYIQHKIQIRLIRIRAVCLAVIATTSCTIERASFG